MAKHSKGGGNTKFASGATKFAPGHAKVGGRATGAVTLKTREVADRLMGDGGLTPLDYMAEVYRNTELPADIRLDAAKSAAPYMHARIANQITLGDEGGGFVPGEIRITFVKADDGRPVP